MFHRPAVGATNSNPYVPSTLSSTRASRALTPFGPVTSIDTSSSPSKRKLPYMSAVLSTSSTLSPVRTAAHRRVRRPSDDLQRAPRHRERIREHPELERPGSNHPRDVILPVARGAGDVERDVLRAPGLDFDVLVLFPEAAVPVSISRLDLHEDFIPGVHDPRLPRPRRADDDHVHVRRLRVRGAELELEDAVRKREHRVRAEAEEVSVQTHRVDERVINLGDAVSAVSVRVEALRVDLALGFGLVDLIGRVSLRASVLVLDEDADLVRPGDGREESNLARPVPEFGDVDGDGAGTAAAAGEPREAFPARDPVTVRVHANDRQRDGPAGLPSRSERALDPARVVIHRAGFARRAKRNRLRATEKRNLKRAGFRDDVRRLVRPVAVIDDRAFRRDAADARRDLEVRAALEETVPARVPRFYERQRRLARDRRLQPGARQPAHRKRRVQRLDVHEQRRTGDALAVHRRDDLVRAHLPPSDARAVPPAALGERRRNRVRRPRRRDDVHGNRLLPAHPPAGDFVLQRLHTTAAFQSDPTPTSEPPPPPKAAAKPGPGRSATSRGRSGPYVATISDVLSFATRPFTTACAIHRPTSSRMNVHPYVPSSWSTTSIVARRAPEGAVSDTSTWSPPT
eukprot:31510-Pelagococcus_subviridis.AAC.18